MPRDFSGLIDDLNEKVFDLRADVHTLSGKCDLLNEQIETSEQKIVSLEKDGEVYVKSIELLTVAQVTMREGIRQSFEKIITFALQHILGADYEFYMEFDRRGNLQTVDFNVKSKDLSEPFDPLDTSGGGVVDIVSLALRVALLELQKPRVEGPLVLDESFKHLSRQNLSRAGEFLSRMSERMNRQIIMVSHKSELVDECNNNIVVG